MGEFEKERTAFAEDWRAHTPESVHGTIWLAAYASVATTRADAERAMAALPSYAPLSPFRPWTTWHAAEGHVAFLSGDADRALLPLERGARACVALEQPVARVRASLWLGQAREDKNGDLRLVLVKCGRRTAAVCLARPRLHPDHATILRRAGSR